jgi:hypothetical protein
MDSWLVYPIGDQDANVHGLREYSQQVELGSGIVLRNDEPLNSAMMDRLLQSLQQAIMDMQAFFLTEGEDNLSVTIDGQLEDGQPIQFGMHRQPVANFQAQTILETISSKLQSAQTFQGSFQLIWILYRSPTIHLLGNVYRGNWDEFVATKQGFFPIHPPEDPFRDECFFQWIILSLAFWKKTSTDEIPDRLNYLRLSKSTFYNLTKKGEQAFKQRHVAVERFKEIFHQPTADFQLLDQLAELCNIRFCLYSFCLETKQFQLVYPPLNRLPYNEEQFTCFGVCRKEGNHISHVDFVSQPDSMELFTIHIEGQKKVNQGHVCRKCFQFYVMNPNCKHGKEQDDLERRNKQNCATKQIESCPRCHLCVGCCGGCHNVNCESRGSVKCPDCFTLCKSIRCLNRHEKICKAGYMREKKPVTSCPICLNDRHEGCCYLKPISLKKPSTQYAVYDFECALDEHNVHVPYCVAIYFPYGHSKLNELCKKYPHRLEQKVFIFWGLHTESFWNFLADTLLKGTIFFAHNGRAYDTILIKSYLWTRKQWVSMDVCRGRKFLQISYPKYELEFRDSLSFIPTSLRSCSADFGIEEFRKGFFPYRWLTVDRFHTIPENGLVERPGPEWFETDFRSAKEREEANQFIREFTSNEELWNVKEDAIEYCISDTLLLGETFKRFRDETILMCEKIERPSEREVEAFDPMQYMTLPSAIMSFYLSQCLPEQTIGLIDRYMICIEAKARDWLHSLGKGEYWVGQVERGCFVAGKEENHRYLFLACELHGCEECFANAQQGQWHTRMECTYAKAAFIRREAFREWEASNEPYTLIWEHQYRENNPLYVGLDPREAYKGGKTELYKLRVQGECSMVDFVSQYPTVCVGESIDPLDLEAKKVISWDLPIGQPTRMYRPQNYCWDKDCLGVAKVVVCPPSDCYAPILSYRINFDVYYGCCRTCMETKSTNCTHTVKEKSFLGTWTLSEIRYALSIGYTVEEVVEVWEYAEKSNSLFRSFIVPFMYNKIVSKSSGLVTSDGQFTEKGNQVAAYLRDILGRDVCAEEFSNAPARRTVAKLIQNAFTGKWGQRDVFECTRSFTKNQHWESAQLLHNPNVKIQSAVLLPDQCVTLTYEKVRGTALSGLRKKNDLIVSHITAYGRIMLNRVEQALGKHLVYVDTDSAYHMRLERPIYRTGFRTGDLELECPSLYNWSALARKSYAYETEGKVVVKQKGIAMRYSLEASFGPQQLNDLIVHTKRKMNPSQSLEQFRSVQPTLRVPQTFFTTEKECLNVYKQTCVREKDTRLNVYSSKRWICWSENGLILDTLPYGWKK